MKKNHKIISKVCKDELSLTQKRRGRFFAEEKLFSRDMSIRTMMPSSVPLQAGESCEWINYAKR